MGDKDQRTEKPSQQKMRKARREGRFPVSRDLVFAVQFGAFVLLATTLSSLWRGGLEKLMRQMLVEAFQRDLTAARLVWLLRSLTLPVVLGGLAAGLVVWGAMLAAQLASTGLGFSGAKLAPDFSRLNPMQKLSGLPRQNRQAALQAMVMLPLFGWALWAVVRENLEAFMRLPGQSVAAGFKVVGQSTADLLWRSAGVFAAYGAFDYFMQRKRYLDDLKMTKQEVREEFKESDGNPEIKMRIRRLRRDLLRRRMMAEVQKATAVIVNPTHFAVALRYNQLTMATPKVVAKGKNYLALRIRQKALENQVPIVENPPLAQALYKQVETGQEIPPHLYRAVAEILAYLYRVMNGRLPG
jgi:flagellar biosynthetic protein FlhB